MWDLIVSVPDHCLSIYSVRIVIGGISLHWWSISFHLPVLKLIGGL